ncbi:MAG: methyltransferase domain-containing protein [Pirellulaceae bacterium]|jgi:SAM-dependent methyltransferase|nr:methyltransferase domain-containing protein [Pirellulaceae bacterium]MDP7019009.1 methyltransferase domain-containing protein [Pirellulaceae bacterium]
MNPDERQRWNDRYAGGSHADDQPAAPLVSEIISYLPKSGAALDVAGGSGRNALWLAQRGLDVTLVDISDEGLMLAQRRAANAGSQLTTIQADLERESPPPGPWQLILCCQYLQRSLFSDLGRQLAGDGSLVVIHPTTTNLKRHPRPSRRFLLEPAELPDLIPAELEVVHYREGWGEDDRHEAVLVARPT